MKINEIIPLKHTSSENTTCKWCLDTSNCSTSCKFEIQFQIYRSFVVSWLIAAWVFTTTELQTSMNSDLEKKHFWEVIEYVKNYQNIKDHTLKGLQYVFERYGDVTTFVNIDPIIQTILHVDKDLVDIHIMNDKQDILYRSSGKSDVIMGYNHLNHHNHFMTYMNWWDDQCNTIQNIWMKSIDDHTIWTQYIFNYCTSDNTYLYSTHLTFNNSEFNPPEQKYPYVIVNKNEEVVHWNKQDIKTFQLVDDLHLEYWDLKLKYARNRISQKNYINSLLLNWLYWFVLLWIYLWYIWGQRVKTLSDLPLNNPNPIFTIKQRKGKNDSNLYILKQKNKHFDDLYSIEENNMLFSPEFDKHLQETLQNGWWEIVWNIWEKKYKILSVAKNNYILNYGLDITQETELTEQLDKMIHTIIHDIRWPIWNIDIMFNRFIKEIQKKLWWTDEDYQWSSYRLFKKNYYYINQLFQQLYMKENETIDTQVINVNDFFTFIDWIWLRWKIEQKWLSFIFDNELEYSQFEWSEFSLIQILDNIISNSIKFTHKGSIKLKVSNQGENIVFDVYDTWIWIEKEKINVIFQKYEQAGDDIQQKYGWTWLGLYNVQQWITQMWWTIHVDSEVWIWTHTQIIIPTQFTK